MNYRGFPLVILNPDMFILKYVLLCFGGEDVCFLGDDEDLDNILGFGQFWFGLRSPIEERPSKQMPCQMLQSLWLNNMDDTRICTGYACRKTACGDSTAGLSILRKSRTRSLRPRHRGSGIMASC